MSNRGSLQADPVPATVHTPMTETADDPSREGDGASAQGALAWLMLLQYCDARSRLEPATPPRHGDGEPHTDPWPTTLPLRHHRMRARTPDRPWEVVQGVDGRTTTFAAGEHVLRCGFGPRAVNAIHRETAYLEGHTSSYLPELTAYGHGWIETRIAAGDPPERPGPWLHNLGRVLREMHELDRPQGRPGNPGLHRLQRVCGNDTGTRARSLVRRRGSGRDAVTTHGNLRTGNIVTRRNRHLLVVTGFDRVRAAAPERDTVAALLGLAPVVGVEALARALPLAHEPGALTSELLAALDRLAGSVGGSDPDAMTRRSSVRRLTEDLLDTPELVDEIAALCGR